MADAKAAVCQPGKEMPRWLGRELDFRLMRGSENLPNKISGRRPLFLM
jgi:hypothetical protein